MHKTVLNSHLSLSAYTLVIPFNMLHLSAKQSKITKKPPKNPSISKHPPPPHRFPRSQLAKPTHYVVNKRGLSVSNQNAAGTPQSQFPIAQLATIDLSPFIDPITKDPLKITPHSRGFDLNPGQQHVVNSLSHAVQNQGFFYIKNSPLDSITPLLQAQSHSFFSLPLQIKQKSAAKDTRRGWHPFQAAPETIGEENDKIEAFTMQTPYKTDSELLSKYVNDNDDDNNNCTQNKSQWGHKTDANYGNSHLLSHLNLPPGVYIDPEMLAEIQAELSVESPGVSDPAVKSSSNIHDKHSETIASKKATSLDTNNWPSSATPSHHFDADKFKQTYLEYWNASVQTVETVLTIIALGLNISPQSLIDLHSTQNHTLESKFYPVPSPSISVPRGANLADEKNDIRKRNSNYLNNHSLNDIRIRFPVHSDMTSITLLTQTHTQGGLMIKTKQGGWERVGAPTTLNNDTESHEAGYTEDKPHVNAENKSGTDNRDGTTEQTMGNPIPVLVNIGDFLSHLSGGKLHSSLHCVANINDIVVIGEGGKTCGDSNSQLKPRISTVFFAIPDYHAVISDMTSDSSEKTRHFTQPYEAGDRLPVISM